VVRWRILLSEFAPQIRYVEGEKNTVADALSRLLIKDYDPEEDFFPTLEDCFDMHWRNFQQPLTFKTIGKEQLKDKYVAQLQQQSPDRLGHLFDDLKSRDGIESVLTERDAIDGRQRVIVPKTLRQRLIHWYHAILVHPGAERLHSTLDRFFTWPKMRDDIKRYTRECHACQLGKRGQRGRGHVPIKDVERTPWEDAAVDLSGPWKTTIDSKDVSFHTFTIIDPFTGWVEILPIKNKGADNISNLFQQNWLRRYPRPARVIYDAGSEFIAAEFQTLLRKWYIKPVPITVKNPRANAIVERMHAVLGNMIRCQLVTRSPNDDPLNDMTTAAAYAIRSTVHGVNKYSPGQLVFHRDMIQRLTVEANVELVRQRREAAIKINNARENRRRISHAYQPGDKVLILPNSLDPKLKLNQGPYKVISYDKSNGTLHIQRQHYIEPINIRNVRPYFGRHKAKA